MALCRLKVSLIKVILITYYISQLCISQNDCIYTVSTDKGQRMLYLDALKDISLSFTADQIDDKHTYEYTPCRNGAGICSDSEGSGGQHTSMCRQTIDGKENINCTVIANFDLSVIPEYLDDSNGTWIFNFENGDDNNCPGNNPRQFQAKFICNLNAGDGIAVSAGEGFTRCTYLFIVETKWACPNEIFNPSSNKSNTLSPGSIFLIILLSIIFGYFLFGWFISSFINRKDRPFNDIYGNIPHVTFWRKLPSLVYAGCCFTKDFCVGMFQKEDNSTSNGQYEDM